MPESAIIRTSNFEILCEKPVHIIEVYYICLTKNTSDDSYYIRLTVPNYRNHNKKMSLPSKISVNVYNLASY